MSRRSAVEFHDAGHVGQRQPEGQYVLKAIRLDIVHQPAKGLLAGFESQNKAPRAYALACHDAEQSAIRADINEAVPFFQPLHLRSEEHTSELQSLIRNSYAVFCLKTKIIT